MKIVYIAHPISGDIQRNLKKIIDIVREINITHDDVVPFCHYWVDCHALDDNNLSERERGIQNDREFFKRKFIDEVWVYGDKISNGMLAEIRLAKSLNIPIISMSEKLNKLLRGNSHK